MAAKTDGCGRDGVMREGGIEGKPWTQATPTPTNSLYIIKTCPGHRRKELVIECDIKLCKSLNWEPSVAKVVFVRDQSIQNAAQTMLMGRRANNEELPRGRSHHFIDSYINAYHARTGWEPPLLNVATQTNESIGLRWIRKWGIESKSSGDFTVKLFWFAQTVKQPGTSS